MTGEVLLQQRDYKRASLPRKIGRGICDVVLPTYVTYPWRRHVRHSYPREENQDTRAFWGGLMPSFAQVLAETFGVGLLASAPPGGNIRDAIIWLVGTHVASKTIEGATHVVERTVWEKSQA